MEYNGIRNERRAGRRKAVSTIGYEGGRGDIDRDLVPCDRAQPNFCFLCETENPYFQKSSPRSVRPSHSNLKLGDRARVTFPSFLLSFFGILPVQRSECPPPSLPPSLPPYSLPPNEGGGRGGGGSGGREAPMDRIESKPILLFLLFLLLPFLDFFSVAAAI